MRARIARAAVAAVAVFPGPPAWGEGAAPPPPPRGGVPRARRRVASDRLGRVPARLRRRGRVRASVPRVLRDPRTDEPGGVGPAADEGAPRDARVLREAAREAAPSRRRGGPHPRADV